MSSATSQTAHLDGVTPAPSTGKRQNLLYAGAAVILAGAVQADGGILTQAYRGASPVAEDQFSFPWQGATALATTLTWGLTQALLVAALVVFARSGATGPSRAGRLGAALAVAGGALWVAGHALTLFVLDARVGDAGTVAVIAVFVVGSLLTLAGFLMAGVAVLRARRWTSWRRYAPLAVAVGMLVVIPVQFTSFLALSVAGYATTIVALGVAMVVEGAGRR